MKLVFLDFDGVINCDDTQDKIMIARYGGMFTGFDDEKIMLIDELVRQTGAKVVISSTWRFSMSLHDLERIFKKRGYTHGRFYGETPKSYTEIGLGFPPMRDDRGGEIQAYLDQMPTLDRASLKFVVIDDLVTKFLKLGLQVLTDDRVGMTEENLQQAIDVLNKDD